MINVRLATKQIRSSDINPIWLIVDYLALIINALILTVMLYLKDEKNKVKV